MNDTRLCLVIVAALMFGCASLQASTWTGGMLYERFGVTLETSVNQFEEGKSVRYFSNSWTPTGTPHPLAQFYYTVNDFYGWPSDGSPLAPRPPFEGGTVINDPYASSPTWPQGGEIYDTEAIYMTNDEHNIYVAIVTSTPPPPGFTFFDPEGGETGEGYTVTVSTGDLAIHTEDGDYWYGVDVNLADRGEGGSYGDPMSTDIGQGLYKTEGEGWYTTNFATDWRNYAVDAPHPDTGESPDSNFYGGGMPGNRVGDVIVRYLQTGLQEGYDPAVTLDADTYSTWEVNFTIPLRLLPEYYSLKDGESREIGFHFVTGCRNDGNDNDYILRLDGEVHAVPEPGTLALTALGLLGLVYLRRRRGAKAEQA